MMNMVVRDYRFWVLLTVFLFLGLVHIGSLFSLELGSIRYLGLSRYTLERIIFMVIIVLSSFLFGRNIGLVTVLLTLGFMLPNALLIAPLQTDALLETAAIIIGGVLLSFLFESRRRTDALLQIQNHRVKHLSEKLLSADETERQRIGQELHDSIGQSLAVLGMALGRLKKHLPERAEAVNDIETHLQEVIQETRDLSHILKPPLLEEDGLANALQVYFDRLHERTGITVNFTCPDREQRYSYNVETVLFRIVQEALTNIIRYAHTRTAWISLEKTGDSLELTVRDAGAGFDPANVNPNSLGLRGMQQRAQLVGGEMTSHSIPGKGTTLHILIPVKELNITLENGADDTGDFPG